jgi:hypothetical protein
MYLVVHAIARFVLLLLTLVAKLAVKGFFGITQKWENIMCKKMSLCNGINKIVYSVNVISVVSIYCHCVLRKLRDLLTMVTWR